MVNKNVSLWSYEFLMNGWTMDLNNKWTENTEKNKKKKLFGAY